MNPLISIIIPTFNAKEYLELCLKSIGNYEDVEVIVVNDGSTDGTAVYLLSDITNNQFINFQENKGQSIAVNEGVKQAKGKYILLVNDDMVFMKNWREKLDKFLFLFSNNSFRKFHILIFQLIEPTDTNNPDVQLMNLGKTIEDFQRERWMNLDSTADFLIANSKRNLPFIMKKEDWIDWDENLRFLCDTDWWIRTEKEG